MQLVLCNNRVLAHGENFISVGGVVINTKTGAKYENATVAECNGCPSDIGQVGYEYHAGVFVPCAPYGKATDGEILIACDECATPRKSGVRISGITQIKLLWENAAGERVEFSPQTITLASDDYTFLLIEAVGSYRDNPIYYYSYLTSIISKKGGFIYGLIAARDYYTNDVSGAPTNIVCRYALPDGDKVKFGNGYTGYSTEELSTKNECCKPMKIYGVKACYI